MGFLKPHTERIYALLRIMTGFMFMFHGLQKVFGQPRQHLLLQHVFVHGRLSCPRETPNPILKPVSYTEPVKKPVSQRPAEHRAESSTP